MESYDKPKIPISSDSHIKKSIVFNGINDLLEIEKLLPNYYSISFTIKENFITSTFTVKNIEAVLQYRKYNISYERQIYKEDVILFFDNGNVGVAWER